MQIDGIIPIVLIVVILSFVMLTVVSSCKRTDLGRYGIQRNDIQQHLKLRFFQVSE
jgi:hypothetical protein